MKTKYYIFNTVATGIECPPSVKDELWNILYHNGILSVENFCQKTESEIRSIEGITPYMLVKFNEFLEHYGLRFGMTKEEVLEYKDRRYFLEHPEEKALLKTIHEEEMERVFKDDFLKNLPTDVREEMENEDFEDETILNSGQEKEAEEPSISGEESDEIRTSHEEARAKERMEEIDRVLFFNYDPSACIRPEEWEITLHSAAIRFMTHDSFLVKLFVPDKVRLKRAFRNAERLYELLREDASERGRQMRALNNEFIEERNSLKTNFPKLFNPYFHR